MLILRPRPEALAMPHITTMAGQGGKEESPRRYAHQRGGRSAKDMERWTKKKRGGKSRDEPTCGREEQRYDPGGTAKNIFGTSNKKGGDRKAVADTR